MSSSAGVLGSLTEAASVLVALDEPGQQTAEAFLSVVGERSRFRAEAYQAVGVTMVHLEVDARDAVARMCPRLRASSHDRGGRR